MNYSVNNMDSLEKLRKDKSIKQSIRKVMLDIPDKNLVQRLERKLNKHYFACGCQEGAFSVYLALFGVILSCWLLHINIISSWWRILTVLAIAALFGKLFGLLLSSFKLKKIYHNLENYFNNEIVIQ